MFEKIVQVEGHLLDVDIMDKDKVRFAKDNDKDKTRLGRKYKNQRRSI